MFRFPLQGRSYPHQSYRSIKSTDKIKIEKKKNGKNTFPVEKKTLFGYSNLTQSFDSSERIRQGIVGLVQVFSTLYIVGRWRQPMSRNIIFSTGFTGYFGNGRFYAKATLMSQTLRSR